MMARGGANRKSFNPAVQWRVAGPDGRQIA